MDVFIFNVKIRLEKSRKFRKVAEGVGTSIKTAQLPLLLAS